MSKLQGIRPDVPESVPRKASLGSECSGLPLKCIVSHALIGKVKVPWEPGGGEEH